MKDRDALFQKLWDRENCTKRLIQVGYKRRLTLADTEGYIADTMFKAWQALDRFDERSKFFTWVCRIFHNVINDAFKKKRPTVVSYDRPCASGDWYLPVEYDTDTPIYANECARRLADVLSAEQLHLFMAYEIDGLSYEELAQMYRVPTGTIKSRLHRVRLIVENRRAYIDGKHGETAMV